MDTQGPAASRPLHQQAQKVEGVEGTPLDFRVCMGPSRAPIKNQRSRHPGNREPACLVLVTTVHKPHTGSQRGQTAQAGGRRSGPAGDM